MPPQPIGIAFGCRCNRISRYFYNFVRKNIMHKRHTDRYQYFRELALTSEKYFIPFIDNYKTITSVDNILEFGCGEGGNLLPFAKRGCTVTGIDISAERIAQARHFFAKENTTGRFIHKDIFSKDDLIDRESYDLIIIHDVIEHVHHKKELLLVAASLLKPDGIIYIGFPAWQMPFGGHQQIAQNKCISYFPYLHLLPTSAYRRVLRLAGESQRTIDELLDIKECRTSIELFKKTVSETDLTQKAEEYYFINPHYEIKFGLRPRKLFPLLATIPLFRNFMTTSYFCILTKKRNSMQFER